MRIEALLHNDVENVGSLEKWAAKRGFTFSQTRTYLGEPVPSADSFDMLLIMGGEQSAGNLEGYPYLKAEIALIQEAHKRDIPIVGICLGSQLIARAFGGSIGKTSEKEIGFFPISLTQEGERDPLFKNFSPLFNVLHWHGEEVTTLPSEAIVLASSAGCSVQAFRIGEKVLGFQFHVELEKGRVCALGKLFPHDLTPGLYTQSVEEIAAGDFTSLHEKAFLLLDRFLEKALAPAARA